MKKDLNWSFLFLKEKYGILETIEVGGALSEINIKW